MWKDWFVKTKPSDTDRCKCGHLIKKSHTHTHLANRFNGRLKFTNIGGCTECDCSYVVTRDFPKRFDKIYMIFDILGGLAMVSLPLVVWILSYHLIHAPPNPALDEKKYSFRDMLALMEIIGIVGFAMWLYKPIQPISTYLMAKRRPVRPIADEYGNTETPQ